MSKCARPMPWAVCVGFSRSCAATAWAKRSRFLAILPVSGPSPRGRVARVALDWGDDRRPATRRPAGRSRRDPSDRRCVPGWAPREVIRTVAADEGLRRHRLRRRRRARPERARGRDLRTARTQRRRQDDDRRDAHHARHPHVRRRAYVGAIDVVAQPALAKQLIGIVSQQNTLDRQLNGVGEPLLPRTPVRHLRVGVAAHRRRAAGEAAPLEMGQGVGLRALRRDGPAADDGARDLPPPGGAVPRRAHRRPRPAEPPGAVGDPRRAEPRGPDDPAHHPLHGGGRSSCATAWRSWITAGSSRSTRRMR